MITGNIGEAIVLNADSTGAMIVGNSASGNRINGAWVLGGTVPATVAWGANLPYVLGGPVYVSSGVTLTVPPLAVVKAAASVFMLVQGTLNADGAEGKSTRLDSSDGYIPDATFCVYKKN